jgi:hypothetical protein
MVSLSDQREADGRAVGAAPALAAVVITKLANDFLTSFRNLKSFTFGRALASPSHTRGGSRPTKEDGTCFQGEDVINPAVHFGVSGAGPRAWFGWPDIPQLEKLVTAG